MVRGGFARITLMKTKKNTNGHNYDAVTPFYYGLALVEQDGKLQYIDHDGTVVLKEE